MVKVPLKSKNANNPPAFSNSSSVDLRQLSGLGKTVSTLVGKLKQSDSRRKKSQFLKNARDKRLEQFKRRVRQTEEYDKVFSTRNKRSSIRDHFSLVQKSGETFVQSIDELMSLSADWWCGEDRDDSRAYALSDDEINADYALDMLCESLNAGFANQMTLKERNRLIESSRSSLEQLVTEYTALSRKTAFRGFGNWIGKVARGLQKENGMLSAQLEMTEDIESDFAKQRQTLEESVLQAEYQEFTALNTFYDELQKKKRETKCKLESIKDRQRAELLSGTQASKPAYQLQEIEIQKHELKIQLSILHGELEEKQAQLDSRTRRKVLAANGVDQEEAAKAILKESEAAHEKKAAKLLKVIGKKQGEVSDLKSKLKRNNKDIEEKMGIIEASGDEGLLQSCLAELDRLDITMLGAQATKRQRQRPMHHRQQHQQSTKESGNKTKSKTLVERKRKRKLEKERRKIQELELLKNRRAKSKQVATIETEVERLVGNTAELKKKISEAERIVKQHKRKSRKEIQRQAELEQAQKVYSDLLTTMDEKDYTSELESVRRENESTTEVLAQSENEIQRINGELMELKKFLRKARTQLEEAKHSKTNRAGKYDKELKDEIIAVKGEVEHHSDLIASMQETMKQRDLERAQAEQLEKEMAARELEIERIQKRMEAMEQEMALFGNDDTAAAYKEEDINVRVMLSGLAYLCHDMQSLDSEGTSSDLARLEQQLQLRCRILTNGVKLKSIASCQMNNLLENLPKVKKSLQNLQSKLDQLDTEMEKVRGIVADRKVQLAGKLTKLEESERGVAESLEAFMIQMGRTVSVGSSDNDIIRAKDLLHEVHSKQQEIHFERLQVFETMHQVRTGELTQYKLQCERAVVFLHHSELYVSQYLENEAMLLVVGFVEDCLAELLQVQPNMDLLHLLPSIKRAGSRVIGLLESLQQLSKYAFSQQSIKTHLERVSAVTSALNQSSSKSLSLLDDKKIAQKRFKKAWQGLKESNEAILRSTDLNEELVTDRSHRLKYDQALQAVQTCTSTDRVHDEALMHNLEEVRCLVDKINDTRESDGGAAVKRIQTELESISVTFGVRGAIPQTLLDAGIELPSPNEELRKDFELQQQLAQSLHQEFVSGTNGRLVEAQKKLAEAKRTVKMSNEELHSLNEKINKEERFLSGLPDGDLSASRLREDLHEMKVLRAETEEQNAISQKLQKALESETASLIEEQKSASPTERQVYLKLKRDMGFFKLGCLHLNSLFVEAEGIGHVVSQHASTLGLLWETEVALCEKQLTRILKPQMLQCMDTLNKLEAKFHLAGTDSKSIGNVESELQQFGSSLMPKLLDGVHSILRVFDLASGCPGKHVAQRELLRAFGDEQTQATLEIKNDRVESDGEEEEDVSLVVGTEEGSIMELDEATVLVTEDGVECVQEEVLLVDGEEAASTEPLQLVMETEDGTEVVETAILTSKSGEIIDSDTVLMCKEDEELVEQVTVIGTEDGQVVGDRDVLLTESGEEVTQVKVFMSDDGQIIEETEALICEDDGEAVERQVVLVNKEGDVVDRDSVKVNEDGTLMSADGETIEQRVVLQKVRNGESVKLDQVATKEGKRLKLRHVLKTIRTAKIVRMSEIVGTKDGRVIKEVVVLKKQNDLAAHAVDISQVSTRSGETLEETVVLHKKGDEKSVVEKTNVKYKTSDGKAVTKAKVFKTKTGEVVEATKISHTKDGKMLRFKQSIQKQIREERKKTIFQRLFAAAESPFHGIVQDIVEEKKESESEGEGETTKAPVSLPNTKVMKMLRIRNQLKDLKSRRESLNVKLSTAMTNLQVLETQAENGKEVLSSFSPEEKKYLEKIAELKDSLYEAASKIADLEIENERLRNDHTRLSQEKKNVCVTKKSICVENLDLFNTMESNEEKAEMLGLEKARVRSMFDSLEDINTWTHVAENSTVARLRVVRSTHERTVESIQLLKERIADHHDLLRDEDPGPLTLAKASQLRKDNAAMKAEIKEFRKITEDSATLAHKARFKEIREIRAEIEKEILKYERKLGKVKKKKKVSDEDGSNEDGEGGKKTEEIDKDDEELQLESRLKQYEKQVRWWQKRFEASMNEAILSV